jgi:hypothetical protein
MGWQRQGMWGAVCLAAAIWTPALEAQEPAATPEVARPAPPPPQAPPSQGREMNGHVFLPSELVLQPFIDTDFRAVSTFGAVRSTAPSLTLGGLIDTGTREFNQLGYSQTFELQIKLLRWLALRLNGTALLYSGTDRASVLNLGSTIQYGGGGGLTIAQRFGRMLQLALVADASFEPTYSVDIGGAIAASLRAQQVDTDPLFTRDKGLPLRVGVSGALAPWKALGFELMARYEHAFRIGGGLTREDAFVGAGTVDLDLRAISPVPIGLLAGYQVAVPFGSRDTTELWHAIDGGVFYTGRRELALGLEASFRRFPQRARVSSEAAVANIVVRYYW